MKKLLTNLMLALVLVTSAAFAATLDQAKSDGLIGERTDGYLGLVDATASVDVVKLVTDVNEKRKAEYQRIAKANDLTMGQVQALAGKKALNKTRSGDWILVNGGWQHK